MFLYDCLEFSDLCLYGVVIVGVNGVLSMLQTKMGGGRERSAQRKKLFFAKVIRGCKLVLLVWRHFYRTYFRHLISD